MTYMTHKYRVIFNTDNIDDFERVSSIMEVMANKSDSPSLVESIIDEAEENNEQLEFTWDEDHADYRCNNPRCALCSTQHFRNWEE